MAWRARCVCLCDFARTLAGGRADPNKKAVSCLAFPGPITLLVAWERTEASRERGRSREGVGDTSVLQYRDLGPEGWACSKLSGEGCTASPYPSQAGLGWPQPRPRGSPPNDPTLPRSCSAKTTEGSVCDLVKAKSCWGKMRTPCPALPTLPSLLGQKGWGRAS